MPVLPSFQDLGGDPAGNSGRIMPSFQSANAGNATLQEAARLQGEGLRSLGKGVSDMGTAIGNVATRIQDKEDNLDTARAQSDWLIRKAKLDDERGGEQDQDVLRKEYPTKYQDALDGASTLIRNESAREKFRLTYQPHVEQGGIHSSNRADELQKDAFTAGVYTQSQDLINAGLKAKTDADRAAAIETHGKLIDGMVENGYMTQAAAAKAKNDWAQSFAKRSLDMMPAHDRLKALGGATDPVTVAKAFSGMTEDKHSSTLTDFFRKTGGQAIDPRETAWCAAFADAVLGASGKAQKGSLRAADFLNYGAPTSSPSQGDVVVFKSLAEGSSGHVGFVVGIEGNRVRYIAGNDGGAVQESSLPLSKVAGFRVPPPAGTPIQGLDTSSRKATQVAETVTKDTPRSPLTNLLAPDYLSDLRDKTANEVSKASREATAFTKSVMSDDLASIMATGKPLDGLTPEKVGGALGAAEQAEFMNARQRAFKYYSQTSDFDSLPEGQITQRLQALKPNAGEVGYVQQQKLYDKASERAQEIVKARQTDPAGAVDTLPMVQAAKQGVDFNKPETIIPLAKARLAAQEAIGIPEGGRIPISKDEATRVMAPVVNGLAGTERQYLQKIVPMFQQAYGGYADRALQFALEQAKVDADSAKVATSLFKKIGLGQPVTKTDQEALNRAQTNDAMAKAAGGPAPMNEYEAMGREYGSVPSAAPQAAAKPEATGTKGTDVRPPNEAVKALIQNPSRADEFDALFGKGTAKRFLNEHQTMTKGAMPNG